MEDSVTIVVDDRELLSAVCGANDSNLGIIEESLGSRIVSRGNELFLETANAETVRRFRLILDRLVQACKVGLQPGVDYVRMLTESFNDTGESIGRDFLERSCIQIPHGFSKVLPRSLNQALYIQALNQYDIVFCVGPAGTGKTYLAVAHALSEVLNKRKRKLVLTRPVVEAGESLGFLPGDLAQKINPYLRPLYDAMEALIPFEQIRRMEEQHMIEIAPLAYMRGRSLNDCIVILDEAQNTTREQMKMFLTRIGQGSRAIISGDSTQIDLPKRVESGLVHAMRVLGSVQGLHFAWMHTADVVRNPLIRKIIDAYESEKDQIC